MKLEVETQSGERYVGGAVLALADDIALTAWHVVADARSVWGVFADGQRVQVTGCIDRDGSHDLALVKLEKPLPRRRASLCPKLQSVAARAYVIGAPRGYEFSITDGLISQIRSVDGWLQYQLSCPISPGNSGSPILNGRGEVIGIASWTKVDAQNVNFAIPARDFIRLNLSARPVSWEQLAATRPVPPGNLPASRPAAGQVLEAEASAGGFAALQQRLKDSVGKSVTVVIQQVGQTNTYTFTVK
jgi:hypothetical protein